MLSGQVVLLEHSEVVENEAKLMNNLPDFSKLYMPHAT